MQTDPVYKLMFSFFALTLFFSFTLLASAMGWLEVI